LWDQRRIIPLARVTKDIMFEHLIAIGEMAVVL
jgi:hypothetical protein